MLLKEKKDKVEKQRGDVKDPLYFLHEPCWGESRVHARIHGLQEQD